MDTPNPAEKPGPTRTSLEQTRMALSATAAMLDDIIARVTGTSPPKATTGSVTDDTLEATADVVLADARKLCERVEILAAHI